MNVLLDLDGTLTNPREGIVGCIRYALSELGEDVPAEAELERFIGPPLRDAFHELMGNAPERVQAAVKAYRTRFESVGIFQNDVYPDVPNALDELTRRGARLFLATSKPRIFAVQILEHLGLSGRFSGVYGSELDGTLSNKSELIAHILDDAGLDHARTAMVGDRRYDIIGAIENRVRPIGVLWGFGSRSELQEAGAVKLYESPRELAKLVV